MNQENNIYSLKTILVTNTRSYSDNSSVAADLALMIAKKGKKVALLDADFRRPVIHNLFELPNSLGFSDILLNHRTALSVMHERENSHLSILTSGSRLSQYIHLFSSEKMNESMQILREKFDKIIIHGPPFFFTETAFLAAQVDGVVLLIQPGHNKTETSRAIVDKFQRSGAKIIGIVMRDQPKHQQRQSAFIDQLLTYDKRARQQA